MTDRITDEESVVLGRPDWNLIFHDLIASVYHVRSDLMTEQDSDIHAVLICLHEAIQSKTNLHQLAQLCMDHNRQSSLIVKASRPHVWVPPSSSSTE